MREYDSMPIMLDAQMLAAMKLMVEKVGEIEDGLEQMREQKNIHAEEMTIQLHVEYAGEPSFLVGSWSGDWVEILLPHQPAPEVQS